MQQPPRKRRRVDTGSDALNSNDNNHRSLPKQRISHACDRCRSRRAKCDGEQPTCATCATANVACTYGTHTKKRGLPTGYVRLLELLWALVFDKIPGAEDATMEVLRSASVVVGDAGVTLLPNAQGQTTHSNDLLLNDLWARSSVREAIDARVTAIDAGVGDGASSESGSKRRVVWEGLSPLTDHRVEPWTASPPNTQPSGITLDGDGAAIESPPSRIAEAELPHDAWEQIGPYLSYSYCWLPVVPKHDIVRLLSRVQDGSPCTASQKAVLWSALAVSSSLKAIPDQSMVATYHYAAIKELANDKEQPSSHHIAAMLLLGLSEMELCHWKDAYLLVGRAARLLHYTYNTNPLQPDPDLIRIYLGVFVLDTLLSSYLGLTTFVSPQHVMPALSLYEPDGPEEWDPGTWDLDGTGKIQSPVRAMSIFGQLAKLMIVLNGANTPTARPVAAIDAINEWFDQLPKHCLLEGRSGPITPPLANLHMIYQSAETCFSNLIPDQPHARRVRVLGIDAEYNRLFGTSASRSMLHICQTLSSPKQNQALVSIERPAIVTTDNITSCTDIIRDHRSTTEQGATVFKNPGLRSNESTSRSPVQQNQSLVRSTHAPTSFVIDGAPEEPYTHPDRAVGQNFEDTEDMQKILEDILAQEAGNGPFLSNFMQDLGFFDEDMPP